MTQSACIQHKAEFFWWQLSGIQQFMNNMMIQMVHNNNNIIIYFPKDRQQLDIKVTEHFQHLLGENRLTYLRFDLSLAEFHEKSPLTILLDYFVPHRNALDFQGIRSLMQVNHFANTYIFLEQIHDTSQWQEWKLFLEDYHHFALENSDLPKFCVVLSGEITRYGSSKIPTYRWQDIISTNDSMVYSSTVFQRCSKLSGLHSRLASVIAGHLALWDKQVIEELAEANFEDVLKPEKILRRIATQYGWCVQHLTEKEHLKWELGFCNQIDNKLQYHSAYIALMSSDLSEIKRRVWQGQLSVLYPYVEERKQALLPILRPFLYDIHEDCGELKKVDNLEIGEIWYQIRTSTRAKNALSAKVIIEIEKLSKIRNILAHNETIDRELIPDN